MAMPVSTCGVIGLVGELTGTKGLSGAMADESVFAFLSLADGMD